MERLKEQDMLTHDEIWTSILARNKASMEALEGSANLIFVYINDFIMIKWIPEDQNVNQKYYKMSNNFFYINDVIMIKWILEDQTVNQKYYKMSYLIWARELRICTWITRQTAIPYLWTNF